MKTIFFAPMRMGRAMVFAVGLALMVAMILLAAEPAHAKTLTVNYPGDGPDAVPGNGLCNVIFGLCSLRAAIEEANATAEADTINFNIFGSEPHKIEPSSTLEINAPVTIDGYSQPDSKPNSLAVGNDADLKIELSGLNAGANDSGLRIINAANSTVKGLVINQWDGRGMEIIGSGATGNKVTGNFIGTDVSGTADLGNGLHGVVISDAPNNTIGGTEAGARNIISGNGFYGVSLVGSGATGNQVMGNRIGTNASGTSDLGNSSHGVLIFDAPGNTIGGTKAGARNIISGNEHGGVRIEGIGATGNQIMGNRIGTDASGTSDLGNSSDGVVIDGAPGNTIGGTDSGARNTISGNNLSGVGIAGSDATSNQVMSNYIGTDKEGTADLGNSKNGVVISAGASGNFVGGTDSGARNIISGNDQSGVIIVVASATGNHILSNSIHDNSLLGIDLGDDGVTANDPTANKDSDTGPNNLQNFPVLSSAAKTGKKTTIEGTLNSTASTTFTVQFFSSPTADPSGNGEGQKFLGQNESVTTNASGNATFTATTSAVPAGEVVTATATNETTGDTSEFSDVVVATT